MLSQELNNEDNDDKNNNDGPLLSDYHFHRSLKDKKEDHLLTNLLINKLLDVM